MNLFSLPEGSPTQNSVVQVRFMILLSLMRCRSRPKAQFSEAVSSHHFNRNMVDRRLGLAPVLAHQGGLFAKAPGHAVVATTPVTSLKRFHGSDADADDADHGGDVAVLVG